MDNLVTAQALYAAFGAGDVPAILAFMADDVEWESWENNSSVNAGVPWMTPRHGRAEVGSFFDVVGQMEVLDLQVLNMMAGGNQVAVEFVLEVNLPGGGHYRDEELHLWTFNDDGKIVRLRHYTDTAKHIAAAGK